MTVDAGTTIAGKYLVEKEIRKETMAILYAARDTSADRPVWLKVIHPHLVAQGKFVERFHREAEILTGLNLLQVPTILDYGVEGETHYIVTEPVAGRSLKDTLQRFSALEAEQALDYVRQTAECLSMVSLKGVVHRDIRPANIIVAPDGSVKIVNFGFAHSAESEGMTVTEMLGTPDYISPEQAEGSGVDIRSDIYSLGVTLYELLAGETPYHGTSQVEVVMKHLSAPIPSVRHVRPDVSAGVDGIIKRCMAKSADERYQTPAELIADIDRVLGRSPAEIPAEPAPFAAPPVEPAPFVPPPVKPAPVAAAPVNHIPEPAMNNYGLTSAQLRMRRGPLPGRSFPLAGEKAYVGRDQGNDIVIDDPEVSRRHAGISRGPSGYSIEDVGSTNGTFVNGVRITSPRALRDGDIIGLGQVVLAFEEAAEVGGDTVTDMPTAPPPLTHEAPPPPAYASPTPPAPATSAGGFGGAGWFLVGCGCVVLLIVIAVVALIATGIISLPASL
jgi:serine/threonine protein kinase